MAVSVETKNELEKQLLTHRVLVAFIYSNRKDMNIILPKFNKFCENTSCESVSCVILREGVLDGIPSPSIVTFLHGITKPIEIWEGYNGFMDFIGWRVYNNFS
jgi:hypothetical protein